MQYKAVVKQIRELNWMSLSTGELQVLMYLSWVAAVEFAEALRIALQLYPHHQGLRQTAEGELETANLAYGSFTKVGDHSEFLAHFIRENGIEVPPPVREAGNKYLAACRSLPGEVRAMSVFSREEELERIFKEILKVPADWSAPGLPEYRYFLKQHIQFDSCEGGHHDLTRDFLVDNRVLPFYRARLELYRPIPSLFTA